MVIYFDLVVEWAVDEEGISYEKIVLINDIDFNYFMLYTLIIFMPLKRIFKILYLFLLSKISKVTSSFLT